jgi:putative ABC transport system permease protein
MYLKSYFTFLSRNKGYTAINVLGLSLSMMFVILIGVYTWQEYHVNSQYPKADRILVYGLDMRRGAMKSLTSGGNWRLQKYFKSRYPEIESSCAIFGGKGNTEMGFIKDNNRTQYPTLFVDSTFFTMFDIPMILGDARTALNDRNDAVVTEDFARRYFGSPEAAMGKQLNMEGRLKFRVTGVIPAIKHSSIPEADVFLRFETTELLNYALTDEHMSNATGAEVLFLESPGAHLESKLSDMDQFQQQFFWIFRGSDIETHTTLTPLSKFYFTKMDYSACFRRGDVSIVNVLFAVGLVILLFAVFNYVNLTNAISDKRAREMAMRRLVGASHRNVVNRLICESLLLCACSMVIALLLAWAAVPYTDKLLNTDIELSLLASPLGISLLVLFTLLLGLASGVLPATVISQVMPIDIVRGTFHFRSHQRLSHVFIIVQNVCTIVLIAVAFAMSAQIRYLIHLPRGYNTHDILNIPIGFGDAAASDNDQKSIDAWYDGLKQIPEVADMSACYGTPHDGGNNETFTLGHTTISSQVMMGDSHYMKLFGLTAISKTGLRDSSNNEVYVNKQMLAEEGLPMNSRFYYEMINGAAKRINISGVLSDFTIRGLESAQHPIVLTIGADSLRYYQWSTAIQLQGDEVKGCNAIRALYQKIFGTPLDLSDCFLDQQIKNEYMMETRIVTVVSLFAVIAIIISLLGLIAMSTYYIDGRRKEIAIRKVFGSTSAGVEKRLIRQFMSYVLVAFVIAVPLAVWLYSSWVSQYSHRAVWWPWILFAGAVVFLASFLAVFMQSRRAARQNPSVNLKQE